MNQIILSETDHEVSFVVTSMLKSGVVLKRIGFDEDKFLDLCRGIWETVEINNIDELENILYEKMNNDIQEYIGTLTEEVSNN